VTTKWPQADNAEAFFVAHVANLKATRGDVVNSQTLSRFSTHYHRGQGIKNLEVDP